MSGEMVEQIIRSKSRGPMPAISRARREAKTESEEVVSSLDAWRRSLMPVRSVIHWSEVSTSFSRSALVTTLAGSAAPVPSIVAEGMSTP